MKRTLSMITLAAFALMLLGSCAKINERIDNLEKKVDGIENEEIATIESQVESIESSIIDLKSIRDKVQAMSDPATGLSKRIEDLEAFVSDVKKDYATKDWAKTTLVTMEEYEKTCDTVAKIALKVEGFDSSLKACAESLKGWVNGKFGGYYDIATIDAKLAELWAQVDGVDSLRAELAKTREEIDTAKAAIRAEYRAAITSAIKTSEGKLTQALQDAIDGVNATIVPLTGRVGILETKVEALKGRVDSLENMIQTVTIVSAYSDGSVKVEDDTLSIDCIISPAEVVKTLDTANFTILLNKVLTKAVTLDTVPTDSIKVFTKDTLNGTVSIKAYIKKTLAELVDKSLSVAVNVKKDKSNYTTEFVPVTLPGPPKGFVDLGVKNAAGKPLYWAEKNLGADKPEDYGDYYMWGATALIYSAVDTSKTNGAFTFVTANPYGDNYKNSNGWKSDKGFAWANIPFSSQTFVSQTVTKVFTKYTNMTEYAKSGTPDNLTTLMPEDDAATKENPGWHIPTKDEFVALAVNCVWIWTTDYNSAGKTGYIVYKAKNEEDKGIFDMKGTLKKCNGSTYATESITLKESYSELSDTHIFFPAAGSGNGTTLSAAGSGNYWSSTLSEFTSSSAYQLPLTTNKSDLLLTSSRYFGFSIRPVSE